MGHYNSLIDTYLDPARSARAQVVSLMKSGLADLNSPPDALHANLASFTVSMTWTGTGNENLYITDPSGAVTFDTSRPSGYKNGDSVHGSVPEIFYATCYPYSFQTGVYHVEISNYADAENEIATLQVATPDDGVIFTKSLSTGSILAVYADFIPAFDIIVTKGTSPGEYLISFQ